jgi:predicted GNAT superfamily acetyltransferase
VAGSETVIEIRQLDQLEEFRDVINLQKIIWGFADIELLPLRFLVVVNKVGGHVFGAYDGKDLVGFCFAIPGVKQEQTSIPYLHSHMLGVLPDYNNMGIGRRLKMRQREDAIRRGIGLIEWTFDPLELKNAFFNIERLGAIIRRYHENQYGVTNSPLHGGLPTDRCVAEWWLDSPRVEAVLSARRPARKIARRIAYPFDIARIRRENRERAREIQLANGEKFRDAFDAGLAVTGFERTDSEGVYLLEPWE